MIAITVDNELPMLKALAAAVAASPDISSVTEFTDGRAALRWAEQNVLDIAFLDIRMNGMDGLTLAERLQELRPDCRIVFCTRSSGYAVDAFRLHASGYLLKPIIAEAVQREIDYIKGERPKEKLLTVRCFGNFEALAGGVPLNFRRTKTRELLAYLVDRRGACVRSKQICVKLWPDGSDDVKNMNYLRQLFDDLRHALGPAGAGAVLIRRGNSYAVDTKRLDCDYYRYLKTGKPEFLGEYMMQYSWAEETCAQLSNT